MAVAATVEVVEVVEMAAADGCSVAGAAAWLRLTQEASTKELIPTAAACVQNKNYQDQQFALVSQVWAFCPRETLVGCW